VASEYVFAVVDELRSWMEGFFFGIIVGLGEADVGRGGIEGTLR